MSTTTDFLPEGYVPPSSGGYAKIKQGENRLRILSKPLMLWAIWLDNKKTYKPYDKENKPAVGKGEKDSVSHVWSVIVWNIKEKAIEIWDCDKKSIQDGITALVNNPEWGAPKEYDIIVTKSGEGMKGTKYGTTPCPKSPLTDEIIDAATETPINLDNLLIGQDPFLTPSGGNTTQPSAQAKVVTPENWVQGDAVPAGYEVNLKNNTLQKKKLPY